MITRNMNEKVSALYSEYIIDGVPQELTPARILDACMVEDGLRPPCKEVDENGCVSLLVRDILDDIQAGKTAFRSLAEGSVRVFEREASVASVRLSR